MELNKIYQEPCLETLKKMPNEFLDCVITSPPYWQLRDYGYPEQWGLEPTFNEYLEHLWEMMDEIYRVLKPTGTVWINLGDTYSIQSGTNLAISKGKNKKQESTYLINRGESGNLIKDKSLPNKCLLLLPHRFAIGCIERGWIVRNDIIWAKRNAMPESVIDRFSKKHEYIFLMVKSQKYFFDLDAIRYKHSTFSIERYKYKFSGNPDGLDRAQSGRPQGLKNIKGNMSANGVSLTTEGLNLKSQEEKQNIKGKNPGSVSDFWDITTKGSSNEHYAAYNDELIKKPVLSGCPENGIIYDPFMGTGSTAEVALRSNRKYIGSELSSEYCKIAEQRLKPYLQQHSLF